MVEAWLERKGLRDANQVLAYFAVSKVGEAPVDGRTDTNPEGLTAAYGNWASVVASRLEAGGLSCKVYVTSIFSFSSTSKHPFHGHSDGGEKREIHENKICEWKYWFYSNSEYTSENWD